MHKHKKAAVAHTFIEIHIKRREALIYSLYGSSKTLFLHVS